MKDHTLKTISTPATIVSEPLTEMLIEGAKDLIAKAVELELQAMLDEYDSLRLTSDK